MRLGQGKIQRHRDEMGEDVNPSAYIVNLADCMLVLACGFMVAMMTNWNIDIDVTKYDEEDMQKIDASVQPEDLTETGSGYVEAGKVYMDPETGSYYIIKSEGDSESADSSSESTSESASGTSGSESSGTESTGSSESTSSGSGSSSGSSNSTDTSDSSSSSSSKSRAKLGNNTSSDSSSGSSSSGSSSGSSAGTFGM